MPHVLCISAGMLAPKKRDNALSRLHRYLNYGLVGLGTVLQSSGYSVRVAHGNFEDPAKFAERLSSRGDLETDLPLLLSLPSSFALGWAREFVAQIKRLSPSTKVIVGGRWVVAEDGQWVREQLPGIDLVVFGTAESRIGQLLDTAKWPRIPKTDRYLIGMTANEPELLPGMDFSIVDGYEEFQPCVEISRGCGMGCSFCAEADVELGECRSEMDVVRELTSLSALYDGPIRPYFQASFFRPSSSWIRGLAHELNCNGLRIPWRAETRVDGLSPAQIQGLARAGLTVLDLGLESASPKQLLRMGKTQNSAAYLRRASELLGACSDNGVWTKVNVLLSPGETRATVAETIAWLDRHRSAIKGVSVGPTIVFRYGPSSIDYLNAISAFGAKPVCRDALERDGYAHLNLSAEMSHEAALEIARDISRSFMSMNDYYDLKSFSYFPRGFSKRDFIALLATVPPDTLAFHLPEAAAGPR